MQPVDLLEKAPVFQLKGSMLALTILELTANDLDSFDAQLAKKVEQAPQFFQNAPIILALDKLSQPAESFDLQPLVAICRKHGMHILAIRAEHSVHLTAAQQLDLAVLPPSGARERPIEISSAVDTPAESQLAASRIITQPVRSGQQIYAKNSDLIVLAAVSAGAELLADGNIHVYAPLRGRALAGISGNSAARIFCQQLGAELLSIAGHYKVAEDLRRDPLWGKAAQTYLIEEQLQISAL